jgi:hypothetical protein
MGVTLTQKYSHLVEKEGFDKIYHIALSFFPLLFDVVKSGKLSEIISFAIWEMRYKYSLFAKDEYLTFNDTAPLVIEGDAKIDSLDFSDFLKEQPFLIRRSIDWKVYFTKDSKTLFGCLSNDDKILYKCVDNSNDIEKLTEFEHSISSIFISNKGTIFVNTWRFLYRSVDGGKTFEMCLKLSTDESYIYHHDGLTEIPSTQILIGEYGVSESDGSWENVANLYASRDEGKTWEKSDFLKTKGITKHVHLIKYSKLLDKVVLTDGDNKKKMWLSGKLENFDILNHDWKLINRFHIQIGGYTSMVENESKIVLGTDYLGGTNFLVETTDGKKYSKKVIPDPYRRSPVMNLLNRVSKDKDEIWAVLYNAISDKTKCLLMYSNDNCKTWTKVIEYDGTKHEVLLNSASTKALNRLCFEITSSVESKSVSFEITDKKCQN